MKIKVEEAYKIISKYGRDEVPLTFLTENYLRIGDKVTTLPQGTAFDSDLVPYFQQAGISSIDVFFHDRLFAKLVSTFPSEYRQPIGRKNFIDMDRLIDNLETINASSKRKRSIVSLTEIYKKLPNGASEIIIGYGEKLTYKRWNEIKHTLNKSMMIDFRYDEAGIIVFCILNPNDPQYAQKFMQFTGLVSMLVNSKQQGVAIAPDFCPESDIYPINDPSQLLEVYNKTRSSLVIIGESMTEEYKSVLNILKNYDKYVKMMLVRNIDPAHKIDILNKIKIVYGQKLWEGQ